MNFLPYSGGGTAGWVGAFGASALAHVGIVAGLITFYNQTLELAELAAQQEAAFDIAVALEEVQTGDVEGVVETTNPDDVEADPLEAQVPVGEIAVVPDSIDAEVIEETQADVAEATVADEILVAEEAETIETLPEAEVVETLPEADTIDPLPEPDVVEVEPEPEVIQADPIETAALAVEDPVASTTINPVGDDPIGNDDPGGLSPLAPDNSGIQTIASVSATTGFGGLGDEIASDPVGPVVPVVGGDTGFTVTPTTPEAAGIDVVSAGDTLDATGADNIDVTAADTANVTVGDTVDSLTVTSVDTIGAIGVGAADTTEAAAVTGTSSAPAVTPPRPPTAQEIALTDLIRRVRQTESDPCLVALPRRDGADGVGLSLIARDEPAMEAFSSAFITPEDDGLRQTRSMVDDRQCAAISYIRNNVDYPATRLGLRLDNDLISSGESITGVVRGTQGRFLMLMLIDDNGVVQDLQRFTSTSGDFYRFDVPVNREGDPRATKQILLAAEFTQPPDVLRERMGLLAQDVFSGLPAPFADSAEIAVATFDVR